MHSLTSALNGGEWSASHPGRFSPRERASGTYWIGGWVGLRAGLDVVSKRKTSSSRQESNPDHPTELSWLSEVLGNGSNKPRKGFFLSSLSTVILCRGFLLIYE
jgi:hypothetical protein